MSNTRRIDFVETKALPIRFYSVTDIRPEFQGLGLEWFDDSLVLPGFTRRFERIWPPDDTVTQRTHWNPFEHYKVSNSGGGGGVVQVVSGQWAQGNTYGSYVANVPCIDYALYTDEYGAPGFLNKGLPMWYDSSKPNDGFIVPPSDLDDLQQRSLNVMLPIIKSELSILNSVYELKDFKSLPRTIQNIRKLAVKGQRTLRKLLHATADGYLQAKFNILPLLSDIAGFYRALKRTEKRINDFVSRAGRVQHKHYQHMLAEEGSDNEVLHSGGGSCVGTPTAGAGTVYRRYITTEPTIFHAEIEYNYNYTRYQLEHARVLALLDAIGINLNPVIIWNAIPWSFVVDWVLGVNTWLSHQRISNMEPQINILRYLWSVKRTRRVVVTRQSVVPLSIPDGSQNYMTSGLVPLPVFSESAYRRDVGLPPASSFLTSGLSAEELSLGAALVITRKHRPNKRPPWRAL